MNNQEVSTAYVGSTEIKECRLGSQLVLAPNGDALWYKANEVPTLDLRFADNKSLVDATTGTNLVDFSRASDGTYTDSQGVIRNAVTNLLLRSEEFDNAAWTKIRSTITANAAAAPNGLAVADKLIGDSALDLHYVQQNISGATSGIPYVSTVYAKASEVTRIEILHAVGSTLYAQGYDLSSGTLLTRVTAGTTAATGGFIQSVGNGWYRCGIAQTSDGTTGAARVTLRSADTVAFDATSQGVFLWGAQLEQSSTVGEYIPTGATINSAPRFDHNPTTGESLGLLVEEARTNLATWSQVIRSSEWPSQQATTQAINQATAPDGTNTASTLTENSQLANRFIGQTIAVTNTAHTWSVFAKTKERRRILLRESSFSGAAAAFDVTSGTVVGTEAGATATITAYSNGWFRCTMTYTPSTASNRLHGIFLLPDNGTSFATASYQGDNASGIYLWGAQLEAGAFPTSYIKTEASTATRAADVASITGTNFSSWYRQDEGTVFAQVIKASEIGSSRFPRLWSISDGTLNNTINATRYGPGTFRPAVVVGGVVQAAFDVSPSIAPGSPGKFVYAVKQDDITGVTNGGTAVTDTSATLPTVNQMHIGDIVTPLASTNNNGAIARLTYWPQRLSNEVLQNLTV